MNLIQTKDVQLIFTNLGIICLKQEFFYDPRIKSLNVQEVNHALIFIMRAAFKLILLDF